MIDKKTRKNMLEHEKWLAISDESLRAAIYFLKSKKYFYQATGYCHHACETALKGYIAFKQQKLLKTHDLVELVEICASFDKEFSKEQEAAIYINPFFEKFQYPTDCHFPSRDEATLTVKHASSIFELITKKIKEPDTGQKNMFLEIK